MFLKVHFNDEAPHIGSGHRIVFVEHAGRKWVKIRCPWTLRVQRLPMSRWEPIAKKAVPIPKPKQLRKHVNGWLASTEQTKTKAIREMLRAS